MVSPETAAMPVPAALADGRPVRTQNPMIARKMPRTMWIRAQLLMLSW